MEHQRLFQALFYQQKTTVKTTFSIEFWNSILRLARRPVFVHDLQILLCPWTHWRAQNTPTEPQFNITWLTASFSHRRLSSLMKKTRSMNKYLQTHHVDSELKRRRKDRFHVVSTWNPRGVLVTTKLFYQISFLSHGKKTIVCFIRGAGGKRGTFRNFHNK